MAEKESSVVVRRPETRRPVWDPWSEFEEMRRQFDGLLSRAFGNWPFGRGLASAEAAFQPAVDLVETAEDLLLTAHLPGIPQDKIALEVEPERVTLSGEREQPERKEGTVVHLQGIGYGRFTTTLSLPAEVMPDEVQAHYRDGVLEVRLPKAEHGRWRKAVKVPIRAK